MATKEAEKYKNQGNDAFKKGDHAKAIEMYTYATELDPNNPVFYTNRSNAYYLMKNWEKSERDALKSIKCKQTWEKGHYRLGMALMAQDKYKEAMKAFQMSVELAPKNDTFVKAVAQAKAKMMKGMSAAAILKQQGNEEFKCGQIEKAEVTYGKAINACKSDEKDQAIKLDCYANRAAVYRQLYRPEECIADCSAALAIDPNHQKVLIRRAQAYESMEKYKAALVDFELCCRLNPNAAIAFQGANRLRTSMKKLGMM